MTAKASKGAYKAKVERTLTKKQWEKLAGPKTAPFKRLLKRMEGL